MVDEISIHMSFYMMYFIQRFVMNNSESAGSEGTNKERTDETRSVSDGDGVDIIPSTVGLR